ncbi:MAG: hypothetical protein OEU26_34310 [Candidatus Tectomicrobia bacterium]|nr:hypothetical protein [Candidatus Tectomicrobia bacterium]
MIETTLHIMERFELLLTLCDRLGDPGFMQLIEAMYRDAESVFYDSTSLHLDLIVQLYRHHEADEMITWLEAQRTAFFPLLMKVRALAPGGGADQRHGSSALGTFQHGIVGLMCGCAALVDEQSVQLERYGYSGPTVLALLYAQSPTPLPYYRTLYVDSAKKHFQVLERAWEDVVEGYAGIKYQCLERIRRTQPASLAGRLR